MIICPITQEVCKGESCFQIKSETGFLGFLIACEKVDKAAIYITNKDGKLEKVD